tara:strand:- start:102 stop:374 length:273 start_codon:yes stop_codon:yes gene_type:complete
MRKYTWINFNHLKEAREKAGGNPEYGYWWHFRLAFGEFLYLIPITIGSLIHAIFPFLIDFTLLQSRIDRIKYLKTKLPHDLDLKKIHFDD